MLFLCLAGQASAADRLAAAPPVAAALGALDRLVGADIVEHGTPGLAIAIVHGQELLWSRSYGMADLARSAPVGPATRFRLASMSKLLTGLAVMQLRDAGRLRLDDRVTDHLPGFALAGDPHPVVTLRELLLHLGGLPREALGASWDDRTMPDRAALIRDMGEEPEAIPRESQWKYSNLGYAVLGLVIEAASGERYADYVTHHILTPLGMRDTLVEPAPDDTSLATGYGVRGADGVRPARPFLAMGGLTPAAGIVSTAEDMAKLAAWALEETDGPVLAAASRREMLRIQAVFPDFSGGQGLGWQTRRVGTVIRIGHAGQAAGYAGRFEIEPASQLGVIVLTNADEGGPTRLADQALALLAPAIAEALPAPPVPAADPAWQKYIGLYSSEHGGSAIVIVNGRLAWQDPGAADPARNRIYLEPHGTDRFRFLSGALVGEDLVFETDADGKVIRLKAGGDYDWRK
ncbi:MAG TPA: serine hydrolase domain-containing protein [Aliidongia sp.]|nr:serine hydrolase domain-containing protein [Aliidongia sp.]